MHGLPMGPPVSPLRGTLRLASWSGPLGEVQLTTSPSLPSSWFPMRLTPSSLVSRASGAQMLLLNVPSEETVTESHTDSQSCWERH